MTFILKSALPRPKIIDVLYYGYRIPWYTLGREEEIGTFQFSLMDDL